MFVESPNASQSLRIFIGSGHHAGEYLVKRAGTWYLADTLAPAILVDQPDLDVGRLSVSGTEYNGAPVYATASGNWFLFYSLAGYWVLRNRLAEPRIYEDASGTPKGDSFFFGPGVPSLGHSASFTQCDAWREIQVLQSATLSMEWDAWIGPSDGSGEPVGPCGKYTKEEAADRYIGFPSWTCTVGASGGPSAGDVFTRSRYTSEGRFSYGSIRWSGRGYVYGVYGAGTWWEGDEPSKGHETVYRPYHMADGQPASDPDHEPFTLEFRSYVAGSDTAGVYATEISLWR